MWSDWDSIFAETIRFFLKSGDHPLARQDMIDNLRIYDEQVASEKTANLEGGR